MGALVNANTTSDAKALRNVRLACVLVHDDAFLPVSNGWAEHLTFIVALLRLTIVFLQNGNTHTITQPSLSSVLFCFTCRQPSQARRNGCLAVVSNETLKVLVSANEADGARGRELHAGLAECISGREVVGCIDLNGDHTLATLDTGGRTDILSEGTSHTLGDTVSTGTGGLLVLTKHVMREGVDAEGIPLCAGFITDGGVGNDTGCFKSSVANLNIVIGTKFEDDLELARLRSTSVSDMILVDTVVWHTTDVLSAGVGWAFQAAVHHSGFTCHRYASKQSCDRCSLYDISAPSVHAVRANKRAGPSKVFMLPPP